MTLNARQIIAIIVAVLSVLVGSTAQVTDLFGPTTAKVIISVASLSTSILSATLAVLTSQGSTVKNVLAMDGVERIEVNSKANQTLSAIAIDPTQNKISPIPASVQEVTKTAQS